MNELLDWLFGVVESVDPLLRTIIAFVAIFLETTLLIGLVIPGDTVVIVASTAIQSNFEFWLLALFVMAGTLLGQSLGYWLGKHFGPRIRASRLGKKIGEKTWRNADNFIDHRGGIAVLISRFLPVLHSLTPVTVGMSNMRYRRFMAWATPAAIVWAFGYSYVGMLAKGTYLALADRLSHASLIFVGVIALFLAIIWGVKTLLMKSNKRFMETPDDQDTTTWK